MFKKITVIFMALMLSVSMLYGCSKDDKKPEDSQNTENTTSEETNTEENKETTETVEKDDDQYINTFIGQYFNTLDPSTGSDVYGNGVLLNTIEPLVRFDEQDGKGVYVPAGAESWDISEDGLTYTFHIRDNKWSDGQPVTSKDYAYGIRRSTDKTTGSPFANLTYYVKNGQKVNAGELPMEELGVETPDDKTLVITLESPCPYFIDIVMQRVFFPQREDKVKEYGDLYATDDEHFIACGPFQIESTVINNEINYIKNPNYWNADNVSLERVHVSILAEANTIYNALETGELDYASVGDPKWQAKFKDNPDYTYLKRVDPWTGYFQMNFKESSRVANTKITRAIGAVLNRQSVIDTAWNGTPIPAYNFVPPVISCGGLEFNKENEGPALDLINDIKDPKALFEEGVKELGKDPANYTIRLLGSDPSSAGRIAIENFQNQIETALGCKVEATNQEWNAFSNILKSGDYDIAWLAWSADFNDPSNFLETMYSKAPAYDTGWVNEKFDSLIEQARSESDPNKRVEMLREAERILIYDDAALLPINHSVANIFRRSYIKNAATDYFNTMGLGKMYTNGRE